ncbi:MAG TPA: sigma-70 family RNA polymerase sigma factor [Vicinamibacterales bacterium]|nr:sigma-70 family RNA polymerase sigma factor [Vicinamibacterales bacterium]
MTDLPALESVADEELLRRIAAGDIDALGVLFRRRQQNIYRFALHLTGSPSLADDVTQDVFVMVIRDAAKFQPGRAQVPAWLCGMARNFVRRRLASDRASLSIEVDEALEAALPAVSPDPLGNLTTAEAVESLRRAVLSLPLCYREAVVLCDLQELSYADVAAALECPIGTVRSRLNRGRALLTARMQVEQQQNEYPLAGRTGVTRCLA